MLITGETVYCSEVSGEEKKEGLGNRGHIILCTPQEPRGRRGEGIWSPYVTSKVMHIVARGKGEEVSEHLEQRSGGQS